MIGSRLARRRQIREQWIDLILLSFCTGHSRGRPLYAHPVSA